MATHPRNSENEGDQSVPALKNSYNFLFDLIYLHILSSLDDYELFRAKEIRFDGEIEPVVNLAFGNDSKEFRDEVERIVSAVFRNLNGKSVMGGFENFFLSKINSSSIIFEEECANKKMLDERLVAVLNSLAPDILEFNIDTSEFYENRISNLVAFVTTETVSRNDEVLIPDSYDLTSCGQDVAEVESEDAQICEAEDGLDEIIKRKLNNYKFGEENTGEGKKTEKDAIGRFYIKQSIIGEPIYIQASIGLLVFGNIKETHKGKRIDYSWLYKVRVNICFDQAEWLVSGPISQIVGIRLTQRNRETLKREYTTESISYCIIPLRGGYLAPPTFECYLEQESGEDFGLKMLGAIKKRVKIEANIASMITPKGNMTENNGGDKEIEIRVEGKDGDEKMATTDGLDISGDIFCESEDFILGNRFKKEVTGDVDDLNKDIFESSGSPEGSSKQLHGLVTENVDELGMSGEEGTPAKPVGEDMTRYIKISTYHENALVPIAVIGNENFRNAYYIG
ncbi:hypothetical protein AYI69_g6782 [Smittium culicis]|uniref:Uncharacterized protein n=1 Tax=Smittium culicis TaxID=133412 RepID=A0A1R1XWK9_9FUNG|nr:hypothetical protein AYI69_g6782 [Smittium culicis]